MIRYFYLNEKLLMANKNIHIFITQIIFMLTWKSITLFDPLNCFTLLQTLGKYFICKINDLFYEYIRY